MSRIRTVIVALSAAVFALPAVPAGASASGSATSRIPGPSGTPTLIRMIGPSAFDRDLRDLPVEGRIPVRKGGYGPVGEPPPYSGLRPNADSRGETATRQAETASAMSSTPDFATPEESFRGMGGGFPPDPVGDVGPNHYIQMVNSTFQIYTKSGAAYLLDNNNNPAPRNINQIWEGFGGLCESTNRGDPIVLYDQMADRWLLSQFAFDRQDTDNDGDTEPVAPWFECVAISQTPDPVEGGWFRYAIQSPDDRFPDYPKFGIWPDAYVFTTVQTGGNGGGNYALDRASMLAGGPANAVYFDTGSPPYSDQRLLPVDMEGFLEPAPGAPALLMRPVDTTDTAEIWEFDVDFADPLSSTLSAVQSVGVDGFDSSVGGAPQPGEDELLETISDRFMHRATWRRIGGTELIAASHVVDAFGINVSGVRWYQLTRVAGSWLVAQQGTHAPDGDHRWNPSIAMDRDGNMALGYSVSSSSTFPSMRYAGRLAGDPAGTLPQGEGEVAAGGASQDACGSPQPSTCRSRWGDYSSVNVDPSDDCTFWYTNEFIAAGPSRATQIGAFRFCNDPPIADAGGPYQVKEGEELLLSALDSVDPNPTDELTYEWDLDGDLQFDDDTGSVTTFQRGDNGVFAVAVRVTDESGLENVDTTTIEVTNVAPTVELDGDQVQALLEGQSVDVSATFADQGWEDTYTATVDWGSAFLGASSPAVNVTGDGPPKDQGTVGASQQYGDDGTFTVTVSVADDDGGVGSDSFVLGVGNVAPDAQIDLAGATLVNGVPTILGHAGEPVDLTGDASDPGSDDLDRAWDFGDGTQVTLPTSLNHPLFDPDPDPSPTIHARDETDPREHTFGEACAYDISFTAADDDQGADVAPASVLITGNSADARQWAYWKQQYRDGGAHSEFDEGRLLCYLEIARYVSSYLDEHRPLSTVADAEAILRNDAALSSHQEKLDRELLASLLNFADGAFDYLASVYDTDADQVLDLPFAAAISLTEAVRLNGSSTPEQLEDARKLLQEVNQL